MTLLEELAGWASKLCLDDVPDRVVALATSQVVSQLAAARAGLNHPIGQAVVRGFGSPLQPDPARAAAVLAGLTSWLQLDDTAYAGHLSNSTVNVPMCYARAQHLDGRSLLTAIIAANECAARITAAATLGPFRGQSATYTHLAGAICGRLRLAGAPASQWVNALGLAFGMPPRVLSPAFLSSDTKVLHAYLPVRAGLEACDAAAAGLTGTPDILEHPAGFLARFSSIPLPEAVTAGLGQRWHTETLSFKMRPAGPGVDAAVDCAIAIAAELPGVVPAEVVEVVVHAPWYTIFVDRQVTPLIQGPDSPLGALVTWVPYTVATALLTGELTPDDYARPRLADPARWALADKVRVVHDPELTRRSFAGEVPFGEAIAMAGPRAADWEFGSLGQHLGELGIADLLPAPRPPSESFTTARKLTGARVTVCLADGSSRTHERAIPLGAAGPHTREHHPALVREKFVRGGADPAIADELAELPRLAGSRLAELVPQALAGAAGLSAADHREAIEGVA
jgi:2-methylcitrate dehydratase PrpD